MYWYCIILQAARILVQLMCKHEYDARYQALDDKLYIAQQYFPLVGLVSFLQFSDSDSPFSVLRTYRQNVMLFLVGTGFCSSGRKFLQGCKILYAIPYLPNNKMVLVAIAPMSGLGLVGFSLRFLHFGGALINYITGWHNIFFFLLRSRTLF